jgi:hypothetical protein
MADTEASITQFHVITHNGGVLRLTGTQEPLRDSIHQASDLSDVFYAPTDVFAELEATWQATQGTLNVLRTISANAVALLHCSTYVKRFDYEREELNIKAIVLSKGYDIGVCTGRNFVKYYCSDLIYADRFFSYGFGDRKYWFVCYLSSVDDAELITDRFVELFGPRRGPEVFAWLEETLLNYRESDSRRKF